ncbi:MAG: glycosyltransferase family 4 protein [Nitrospira sp.]|nr:MAG: glycosyltransferase family 4 protein [Nitrospira sp.]
MNIVIAAWHLKNFNVGIGRYSRGLIEAIAAVDRQNEYEVLTPTDVPPLPPGSHVRYRVIRFPLFKRRFWEQVAPQLVGPYDLLHLPYDSCVAWKKGKLVVTIHDVKQLLFPALAPKRNVHQRLEELLVGDRRNKIDHILTDSKCSRRDIVERCGVPSDRITVVYPGVDLDRFKPSKVEVQAEVEEKKFGASRILPSSLTSTSTCRTGRPYVLSVAGPDPTKNVETLIEAFARLPAPVRVAHDLVLAGDFRRREDLRERVAALGLEKQVLFPGVVSDERLIELYQNAALLVFPSRYEGFGLPVLEAMACGCPVVSSNAASLPEVAGDAAILVDPNDTDGFARAMSRVLEDSEKATELRTRGLAQAARFTWERTARETIAVYKRIANA